MKNWRWPCAWLIVIAMGGEARAQFLYPPAGGYVYGSGSGFRHKRHHRSVRGFFGGYSYGYFPVGPGHSFAPFGVVENRVIIHYVVPPPTTVVVLPVRLRTVRPIDDDQDISGVDLDLVPAKTPDREGPPAIKQDVPKKPAKVPDPPPPKKELPPPPPKVKVPVPPGLPPPRKDPIEECARLLDIGKDAFRMQLYGVAAHRFRQATVADPKEPQAYFLLSKAQFALGKYREAVETIHAGMRLLPKWPLEKFPLPPELYKGNDDFDEHLKRLEDVQAKNPKNAAYLFLLAHELWFAGRRDQAQALFRRARPMTPDPAFIDVFLRAAAPGPVAAK